LRDYVLPAVAAYETAESTLTDAYKASEWEREAKDAKRNAAEVAVAIDGLVDRAREDFSARFDQIREDVSALCYWPGTNTVREASFARVHSLANAYKHRKLSKPGHVMNSIDDVLTVGLGFGLDGFGVGKYSGVEVLINDKDGKKWKFMGDVSCVLNGWRQYLRNNRAVLPAFPDSIFGIKMT
jgi:hypothetical protein